MQDTKTYIKSYRSIIDHPLLSKDNNAFIVFMKLLHVVNRHTGEFSTGRFKLIALTNLKGSTAWAALKRLERHGMVRLNSTSQMTTISICNWNKYQLVDESAVKTGYKPDDTKQEYRSKNIEYSINKLIHVETQGVYDHFIKTFNKNPNSFKLTDKRKDLIRRRLKDAGMGMTLKAITNVSNSPFHMGENDRGWKADLEFILRSYEQVERFATKDNAEKSIHDIDVNDGNWKAVL